MNLRREFGFWPLLGGLRLTQLLEFGIGLLAGVGAGSLAVAFATPETRLSIAGDYVMLSSALIGVVFAGFALIVGLLSDAYLRWLQRSENGVKAFLAPFLVAVGLQVGTLIFTVIYRGAAPHLSAVWEAGGFILLSGIFLGAVLDIMSLARSVLLHGIARARALEVDDLANRRATAEQSRIRDSQ